MIDDDSIAALLRSELPDLLAIYRFGSTAAGDAGSDSDVDLAFLAGLPVDPVRRFQVQEKLAALLHRDVDLVDLQAASTVMRMQVVGKGLVLAAIDDAGRQRFEDHVFSSYARLNEERRGILDRVRSEGSVHGG